MQTTRRNSAGTRRGRGQCLVQSLAVVVLRAVYEWSKRHYQREVLREALWRISREMAAARPERPASPRSELAARLGMEADHERRVATH
jgi:hypothetical protein